jgi:hypothetical protein
MKKIRLLSRLSGRINKTFLFAVLICVSLLGAPVSAYASVQISEIMYDVPGSDSGREWVEVTNTGLEAVDIAKYKLAEGTTNHGFTVVQGSTLLPPGGSAILADDPAKFQTDWPAFTGTLLNTVFSLSNTGETLVIKNASSSVQDTVSYSASLGAAGDGSSLQRSGSNFIAAIPSPGVFPGSLTPVPKVAKPAVVKPAAKTSSVSKSKTTKSSGSSQTVAAEAAPQNTFDIEKQKNDAPIPMALWVTGLVALIGLGVTGVIYARLGRPAVSLKSETNSQKDEFQIIES